MSNSHAILFAGSAHPTLGQEIAGLATVPLGDAVLSKWSDGETRVCLRTPVAGKTVFLVQPLTSDAHFVELLWMIDAARRSGAAGVYVIAPYLAYARQDKPTPGQQEPHAGALTLTLLETVGASGIVTLDLHAAALASAVRIPVHNLLPVLPMTTAWAATELDLDRLVVTAADPGAIRRAGAFCNALGKDDPAVLVKRRTADGRAVTWGMVGDVQGQPVMLIDDVTSTGSTLVQAAEVLIAHGAAVVYASVSHLRGPAAVPWLDGAPICRLFVTDSMPLGGTTTDKVVAVSIAPLLAQAIADLENASGHTATAMVRSRTVANDVPT